MAATPAPLLRDVGRRIAELRVARGWTQDVFAERMDVSVGYIREVEAGHENLTLTSLVKLSTLLGVTVPDLFVPPASRQVRRGRPPKGRLSSTASTSETSKPSVAENARAASGSTPANDPTGSGSTPALPPTAPQEELDRALGLAITSVTEQANRGNEWASGLRDVLDAIREAVHGVARTGKQASKGSPTGASISRSTTPTKSSPGTKAALEFLGKIGILSKKFSGAAKGKSTNKASKKKAPKKA